MVGFEWDDTVQWENKFWINNLKFRRGTKFVKILFLANYRQWNDAVLYIDDVKLTEE